MFSLIFQQADPEDEAADGDQDQELWLRLDMMMMMQISVSICARKHSRMQKLFLFVKIIFVCVLGLVLLLGIQTCPPLFLLFSSCSRVFICSVPLCFMKYTYHICEIEDLFIASYLKV